MRCPAATAFDAPMAVGESGEIEKAVLAQVYHWLAGETAGTGRGREEQSTRTECGVMGMNDAEFTGEFTRVLSGCYPSTIEWMRGLPRDTRESLRKTWLEELTDIGLSEASEAIRAIHRGHYAGPAAYERECWPGFIRHAIEQMKRERKFQEAAARQEPDLDQPRIWCLDCQDTGIVSVTDEHGYPWGFPCHCERGEPFSKWHRSDGRRTICVRELPRWKPKAQEMPNYVDFGQYGR